MAVGFELELNDAAEGALAADDSSGLDAEDGIVLPPSEGFDDVSEEEGFEGRGADLT